MKTPNIHKMSTATTISRELVSPSKRPIATQTHTIPQGIHTNGRIFDLSVQISISFRTQAIYHPDRRNQKIPIQPPVNHEIEERNVARKQNRRFCLLFPE